MMFHRRGLEYVVLLVAVLYLPGAGCGLFEPRDPILAEQEESVWVPPINPEDVIPNLEAALERGFINDYTRAFTDDFVFFPDEADIDRIEQEFPGEPKYDGWGRTVETEVAETIVGAVDSVRVLFGDPIREDSGGSVLLKYVYTLSLFAGTTQTDYRGDAWFRVEDTGGEWLIFEWEDIANVAGSDSWGLLKGRNRL